MFGLHSDVDPVLFRFVSFRFFGQADVPEKEMEAEMVDDYVDIGDEMPTVNYQSVEIERDSPAAASSSSGSGSGSSSSSGTAQMSNLSP
jgi:hypothetical protein